LTTASSRDSTPTSVEFSEADTLVGEVGLFTKALNQLHFHIPYMGFDIRLLFLFALLVAAFTLDREGVNPRRGITRIHAIGSPNVLRCDGMEF
jgi:hypothetical protein